MKILKWIKEGWQIIVGVMVFIGAGIVLAFFNGKNNNQIDDYIDKQNKKLDEIKEKEAKLDEEVNDSVDRVNRRTDKFRTSKTIR